MSRGWTVLSPDGLPIDDRTWPFALAAWGALSDWIDRFRAQGYYLTAAGERIPVDGLEHRCQVVPPAPRRVRR